MLRDVPYIVLLSEFASVMRVSVSTFSTLRYYTPLYIRIVYPSLRAALGGIVLNVL
jgi:hypothetical protein